MYSYGLKNTYRPSALARNAYGWSTAPAYNRADVPTALMDRPGSITQEQFEQQFAYEWYQSGQSSSGFSNPPFISGAAGRLHPALTDATGHPARILRGYIRRAQFEAGNDVSKARLYFMYNPEVITRDYVSYLEQGALDPFNTVYQSGNLVAPPSILDFSFNLFFDRQEESTDRSHPGVYVDYQYFDLVVRNVVPSDPNQASNTLPDNGVMMVNPRDITVVFSPQFTVQGRPLNARVTFERFTHRMTPTRMSISLTMRAVYIGPVKDMSEYKAEVFAAEAAIPIDEIKPEGEAIFTFGQLTFAQRLAADTFGGGEFPGGGAAGASAAANYTAQAGVAGDANSQLRARALNAAKSGVNASTRYMGATTGSNRYNLPRSADCSGLVVWGWRQVDSASADLVFGGGYPGTSSMLGRWRNNNYAHVQRVDKNGGGMQYGDILIKDGHIRYFDKYEGGKWRVFDAAGSSANPQVGSRLINPAGPEYQCIRPAPLGASMSYNGTNRPGATNVPGA